MSQLHQPKELLQYRDAEKCSAAQVATEFKGKKIDGLLPGEQGTEITLPAPSAVAKESCMFIYTDAVYTVKPPVGVKLFVNGKSQPSVAVDATSPGALVLRSDGLRFIGERLAA